jgi:hypothetical protein
MTLKPEDPITGARSGGLWGKHPGKVNQGKPLIRAIELKLPLFGTHDTSLP